MGNGMVEGGEGRGKTRGKGKEGTLKGWFTPHVANLEKYPDCRTDPIGGAATPAFAPGGKHSRDATER